MRTLDHIYWDVECDDQCGCKDLAEALKRHPRLAALRDGTPEQPVTHEQTQSGAEQ